MDEQYESELTFEPEDFEVLDIALRRDPELRLGAWAAKRRRQLGLTYPLVDIGALLDLMNAGEFVGGGYRISSEDVARYMPQKFFPINSDEDLIGRVRIALVRARQEQTMRLLQDPTITVASFGFTRESES
jgi:hypothetical protein